MTMIEEALAQTTDTKACEIGPWVITAANAAITKDGMKQTMNCKAPSGCGAGASSALER